MQIALTFTNKESLFWVVNKMHVWGNIFIWLLKKTFFKRGIFGDQLDPRVPDGLGYLWQGWLWVKSYWYHIGYQMPSFSQIFVNLEPDTDTDLMVRLASDTYGLGYPITKLNWSKIVSALVNFQIFGCRISQA